MHNDFKLGVGEQYQQASQTPLSETSTEAIVNELFAALQDLMETDFQMEKRLFTILAPNRSETGESIEKEAQPQRLNEKLRIAIKVVRKIQNHMIDTISRVEL